MAARKRASSGSSSYALSTTDRDRTPQGTAALASDLPAHVTAPDDMYLYASRPPKGYIVGLLGQLKTIYSEQDALIDRIRSTRQHTNQILLDPDYRIVPIEVHDATVTDEIQRVAAMMVTNPATMTVTPANSASEKAQTNATLREKVTEAILAQAGRRSSGQDTLEALADAAVGDGGGWCKVLWDPHAWESVYSVNSRLAKYQREVEVDDEDHEDYGRYKAARDLPDDAPEEVLTARGNYSWDERPQKKLSYTDTLEFWRDRDAAKQSAIDAGKIPIRWIPVDVKCVYPVWLSGELQEVIEEYERPEFSVFRQYRLARTEDGQLYQLPEHALSEEMGEPQAIGSGTGAPNVKVIEHYDDTYCTVIVEANFTTEAGSSKSSCQVAQYEHYYGRVPYFFAPGVWMNFWANRKVGWSIAEAKRFLVDYRSFLFTLHAQVCARDALPPLQRVRIDPSIGVRGRTNAPKEPEKWRPGRIYDNPAGTKLEPIPFDPKSAQAIREEIAMVSAAIEKLESPRVKAEIGGGLEGAGFAINQILTEARIRHDPISKGLERLLADVTKFTWYIIRNLIGEKVWVYGEEAQVGRYGSTKRKGKATRKLGWLGLGPEELDGSVKIEWKLDPAQASAKMIEARYWHERISAGTASKDMAIEAMGDNPDEVRRSIAMDEIRATPFYKKRQMQALMWEAGRGDLIFEAIAEEMAATGAVPGAPVQPAPLAGGGAAAGIGGAPGGPPGMGDPAALALSAGGSGARPVMMRGGAPVGGGVGPGAVLPSAGAGAAVPAQNIPG